MRQQRRASETPSRSTEGGHPSVMKDTKVAETKGERAGNRGRGRPVGSRNRPKALIPKELATEILGMMREQMPKEHYEDMRDAIRKGKNISTLREAQILLKLMGPPVWMRLVQESSDVEAPVNPELDPDLEAEIGGAPQPSVRPFDKDLTERIKVLMGLIQLVDRIESGDKGTSGSEKPIIEVFAKRGIDAARIEFVTSQQRSVVAGDSDIVRGDAVRIRTIPDTIPQRSFDVSDSEQESSIGILNDNIGGDNPLSSDS